MSHVVVDVLMGGLSNGAIVITWFATLDMLLEDHPKRTLAQTLRVSNRWVADGVTDLQRIINEWFGTKLISLKSFVQSCRCALTVSTFESANEIALDNRLPHQVP